MVCPICNGTGFMFVTTTSPEDRAAGAERRPCICGPIQPRVSGVVNNAPLKGRETHWRAKIGRVRLKGMKPPAGDYDGPASETIDKRKLLGIEDD